MLPAEERAEALQLELTWIDEMKAGIYEQSIKGDYAAIREARGLIDQRARLMRLYPSGPGDQHLHVHGTDAMEVGIRVVAPEWTGPAEEPPHTIEHQRALPPPSSQSDWREPPKPEELPSNVTPLDSQRSRSSYYARDDAVPLRPEPAATPTTERERRAALAERAKIEGGNYNYNSLPSVPPKPSGKGSWMA